MTINAIINQLEANKLIFKGLLLPKSEEVYIWRPDTKKWCLLEVACHLLDEECEDFKARIKYIFEKPDYEMPSINPEAWVVERDYMSKDYNKVVNAFLQERQKSVVWLREQLNANWEQSIVHPKLGIMSAKLFLSNWLAHDYLHMRQILSLQYKFLNTNSAHDLNYAGNW
ncbi:DinB family protein [Snuella lapsa]|uniref:DinB-like domain-containing protein n=1 Tax=Snuella lapsa TaxID=870481 RepID=A0ABP6X2B0_9FLAO